MTGKKITQQELFSQLIEFVRARKECQKMSIFVDTGIFIGYVNKDDKHHAAASGLIEEIMDNKYGAAFTSNVVFDGIVSRIGTIGL